MPRNEMADFVAEAAATFDVPGAAVGVCADGRADYRDWMGRSSSTVASIECQKTESKLLEGELNATDQKVVGALPADQQQKLRTAERLWVEFRSADCDVFYGKETGSYASIQSGECMIVSANI